MCEHKFVSLSDIEASAYHTCKGDVGPTDVFPAEVVNSVPQNGDICFFCGQIYGLPKGERANSSLVKYGKIMEGLNHG